jgi:N-acetylglucosamine-6-sulfatase
MRFDMSDKKDKAFLDREINRREAIKTMGLASAAGLVGLSGLSIPDISRAGKRPNIIFILSDDHRWDHLSYVGHPFIDTPNMDRLAREGVHFDNAFVTTSLCSPSRASFLTGNYPHTHGVRNNITVWNNENVTFMELLKGAGYDTSFIGKWHMPGKLPELRGVDQFVTFTIQGGQGRYFDCPLIVNGVEMPSRKPYITEELTDWGIEFIEKERENPFCLYLSHKAVHHQFLPPEDMKDLYSEVEDLNLPKDFDPWVTLTYGNLYYGMLGMMQQKYLNYCRALTALDREIGRLLDRLDELGIADDTIIVYAGDNGYFWGEHNLVDKRFPYEESMHIPFIVRAPGLVKDPGRRAEQMILNVDLMPSILEMAGVKLPSEVEGESFVPILKSGKAEGREAWLYEYFTDYPYRVPPNFAVRTNTHKYIEFEGRKGKELYDLVNDPKEKNNLMGTEEGEKLLPDLKAALEELKAGYGL